MFKSTAGARASPTPPATAGSLVPYSVAASTFCSGLSTGGLDIRVLRLASWPALYLTLDAHAQPTTLTLLAPMNQDGRPPTTSRPPRPNQRRSHRRNRLIASSVLVGCGAPRRHRI